MTTTAAAITSPGLRPGTAPGSGYAGLDTNTSALHVVEGSDWMSGRLLGWTNRLDSYECGTPAGPAVYKPLPVNTGGRTFSQIVVGRFHHPVTDDVVAVVWRFYR